MGRGGSPVREATLCNTSSTRKPNRVTVLGLFWAGGGLLLHAGQLSGSKLIRSGSADSGPCSHPALNRELKQGITGCSKCVCVCVCVCARARMFTQHTQGKSLSYKKL